MGDAKAGRYTVHVTTDDPPIYYNNDGDGYTLSGAKNFARIGSQKRKDGTWGEDRAVTRAVRGPVIRVYRHGERLWPLYASQVNALQGQGSLRPSELPKKLVFDGVGDDLYRTVKAVKVGQSFRAVPASEPWRSRYLIKHPTWK